VIFITAPERPRGYPTSRDRTEVETTAWRFDSAGPERRVEEMEGILLYTPANFWAGVLYACMLVGVIFAEYARDERKREPAEVIHLVIDPEELKKAA
jgi:hypothetical protein